MNARSFPCSFSARIAGLSCALALLSGNISGQTMRLSDPGAEEVNVESASISTEITGRIAVTTFDLTFRNPNGRVLEGTFEFPLLEGQTVVRFALDVGGKLREAVPVPKEKGRAVFEAIERRRVDPGLLEQTAGNNYRARVFPIPASGTRRIVIAYQEDLARNPDSPVYRLALDFKTSLKKFSLEAQLLSPGKEPAIVRTTLPLELPDWQDARRIQVERSSFNASGILEITLPKEEYPRAITENRDGREYFYAELPVSMPNVRTRPAPAQIGILWDASGSGSDRDHTREYALLDQLFARLRNVRVHLVLLRDQASDAGSFDVRDRDWSQLRHELENVVYDGATSLDGLADIPEVAEWFLFSDGLFNYGVARTGDRLPLHGTVHAVAASSRADPASLRALARRNNGEFVNLLVSSAQDAAATLRSWPVRILGVDRNPEQVAEVFPEVGAPVALSPIVVTGQLRTKEATLRLRIGHDDSDAQFTELVVQSGGNPGHIAARAWAVSKVESLSIRRDENKNDIRRTCEEFGIVTADTSLIVLETIEDYIRYDIAPPAELRDEWNARRAKAQADRGKFARSHLERIATAFASKVQWWEGKYSKDKPKPQSASPNSFLFGQGEPAQARTQGLASTSVLLPHPEEVDEDVVVLSPFEVKSEEDFGYQASNTLAGARVRTELPDVASSLSVVTEEFLSDIGATDNSNLLRYTTNTATGGARGNFASMEDSQGAAEEPGSGDDSPGIPSRTISLQPWQPNAGYIDRLRSAKPGERYSIYIEERAGNLRNPGFYLDVAGFLLGEQQPDTGLRILSNLAELELENVGLLRTLANRLVEAGRPDLARPLLERVLELRPDEPQSPRDLALVCAALKDYQRAVDLLWSIVERDWDGRFPDIELIALGELNAIVATCGQDLDLTRIPDNFRKNLPVGMRVVLTWNANDCDIDLWVNDPNGEKTYYGAPLSSQGGRISPDFTGGYGPEEFLLRDPKPGKYLVRINYFGDSRQTLLGPVAVQVHITTGFGTDAAKDRIITVRLDASREVLDIGSIVISP